MDVIAQGFAVSDLKDNDKVVSMSILDHAQEQFVLAVTENGYGKRTRVSDYRVTNRGGQGVANIVTSPRNGNVVASFAVTEDDQLMLATDMGKVIRIRVSGDESDQIRVAGRQTQGVTLFSIDSEEKVVSVGLIQEKDTSDEEPVDTIDTPSTDPSIETIHRKS